ncbi:prepilin-type N-terminal cleavage/methylation domain-containing protein [Acinetobacter bereziniae]|nr:prepilin-type N-terminal cleavage/methylation domain-containing protein [Acinetobacter bereziniae]TNL61553.1 prepilin-type N-terminal cleavage/methylation domain-containing protein [Acinetobacter bereziniae]
MILNRVKFCCDGVVMQNNRGFTLIELMVTIAVLAIIASIAAPSFSKLLSTYQANKSNEELLTALKEGKSRASSIKMSVIVCPNKDSSNQEITKTLCLTKAGVSSVNISNYIDANRVILANVDKAVSMGGDVNVVFSAIGSSLDNVPSTNLKARKITICGNKELTEITISVIGITSSEKSGACS